MHHAVVIAVPSAVSLGAWLRWAAGPALIAFSLGRRVERLKRNGG